MSRGSEQPISIVGLLFGICVPFWSLHLTEIRSSVHWRELDGILTILVGIVFLADILCILWWFAKYVYRIQPHASLGSHFLDFCIVATFLLAANNWTRSQSFLMATAIGTLLLVARFYGLYRHPDATLHDRTVLKRALFGFAIALFIVAIGFAMYGMLDIRDGGIVAASSHDENKKPVDAQKDGEGSGGGPGQPTAGTAPGPHDARQPHGDENSSSLDAADQNGPSRAGDNGTATSAAGGNSGKVDDRARNGAADSASVAPKSAGNESSRTCPECSRRSAPPFDGNRKMILLTGSLSAIGVVLTGCLRRRIGLASDIHGRATLRFSPMRLYWPRRLSRSDDLRARVIQATREGLDKFNNLFKGGLREKHGKLRSQVHPDADLRIQSYILAVPSSDPTDADEIRSKAFMVAVSHWLDDLVDGRRDLAVYRKLMRAGRRLDKSLLGSGPEAKQWFEDVYKDLVVQHTDKAFYSSLIDELSLAANSINQGALYGGLVRVALGSLLFTPRLPDVQRRTVLDLHNEIVLGSITHVGNGNAAWAESVKRLLVECDSSEMGKLLLGLTTKTTQEIAFSSEKQAINLPMSFLYSLLFAPLLYFHDIEKEITQYEMTPLDSFDVHYEATLPLLLRCRELALSEDGGDTRRDLRADQLAMAYECFETKLPQCVRQALVSVYRPDDLSDEPEPKPNLRRKR